VSYAKFAVDPDHELEAIADRLRTLRTQHCEPKSAANPNYHAFSTSIAQINRAIKAFRADA